MSPSSSTHETHQLISLVLPTITFICFLISFNITYSVPPPAPDTLSEPVEPQIEEKPPSESKPKLKWTFSGIIEHLRERHRVKQLEGVPGIRESILAILKTSCKSFTSCRRLASPLCLMVLWSAPGLNVLLIFIPLSVRALYPHIVHCGLKSSCSGFFTSSISTIP